MPSVDWGSEAVSALDRLGAQMHAAERMPTGVDSVVVRVPLKSGESVVVRKRERAQLGTSDLSLAASRFTEAGFLTPIVLWQSSVVRIETLLEGRRLGDVESPSEFVPSLREVLASLHSQPGSGYGRISGEQGPLPISFTDWIKRNVSWSEVESGLLMRFAQMAGSNRTTTSALVGDLSPDNLLWDGRRLAVVDLESARTGSKYADLAGWCWNARADAAEALLEAYFGKTLDQTVWSSLLLAFAKVLKAALEFSEAEGARNAVARAQTGLRCVFDHVREPLQPVNGEWFSTTFRLMEASKC